MNQSAELNFKNLYSRAKEDSNIIGFFLGGSRGKGLSREYSDYDVYIIVKDVIADNYKTEYPKNRYKGLDLMVYSLSDFKNLYYWGSKEQFGKYSFAHVKALVDKSDKIQEILNEIAKVPEKELPIFIPSALDAYINFFYRSLKCIRDDNIPAARLEAAYSIPFLLDVIFAIHNGRLRPYYKYLKWEIENFPLKKFPLKADELIKLLLKILDEADYKTQQRLMKITENICREEGFGFQFDSWGDEYTWMMTFNPKKI
jgi:predicted nucleotidyltransferase